MVMSMNGYIARPDNSMTWTSPEDKAWYKEILSKVGVMVSGKSTFEIVQKEHITQPVKLRVVVTHDPKQFGEVPNTMFTDASSKEILSVLEQKGFESVVIAGGGHINSLFLAANLVDELYITVEPVVLGRGIPLFGPEDMEKKLKLLDITKLNDHTIRLHYEVIK